MAYIVKKTGKTGLHVMLPRKDGWAEGDTVLVTRGLIKTMQSEVKTAGTVTVPEWPAFDWARLKSEMRAAVEEAITETRGKSKSCSEAIVEARA